MTDESVEALFARALALPPHEREAYVSDVANGRNALRREVLSLLAHHDAADEFLETPIVSPDRVSFAGASSLEGRRELQAGAVVGPYRIAELLGEGGMGAVYLAEQQTPVRRHVALKVIKLGMDTKQVVARFEQERQALAMMTHPSIASVFDAGLTGDGRPYFVMEFVEGVRITRYCDEHELTIPQRLNLFTKVCDAVQHAHQKGIVHRDLKPSNILITGGDHPLPKIIDFGIAKATRRPLTDKTLQTQAGMLMGTPDYMSPEQADPTRPFVDTRADIFSLGVVLHELLVGALPWRGSAAGPSGRQLTRLPRDPSTVLSRLESRASVARCRRTDPGSLRRAVRGDLDAITLKALEEDVDRRYASVSELSADVRSFLDGEPVSARVPSYTYRLGKLVQRHKAFFTAIAAVVVALTAGLVTSTYLYVENVKVTELSRAQRDDIFRLSDGIVLERVVAVAEELWPAHPDNIPRMEAWLAGEAQHLLQRLPLHRDKLRELERQVQGGPAAARFDDPEAQFQYELLRDLVDRLERFADDDTGLVARMRSRLAFASTIRRRSLEDHRDEWRRAIVSIADRDECRQYEGLRIAPQLGLIPIGRDPESGMWEFAHLQTGEAPQRGGDGRLLLTEKTGMVFVLLPGGSFRMGAVGPTAEAPAGRPNVDPWARPGDGPVHTITIRDPFFISKYEMTQAQWLLVNGENPSAFPAGAEIGGRVHTPLHPVEKVSWWDCDRTVRRLGLALPTEAQWEYAARAGTSSVWWTGSTIDTVRGAENIADLSYLRRRDANPIEVVPWDDGFPHSSPVGTFRANAFGLHDVMGNVWEWCRDAYGSFELPARESDGLRLSESDFRLFRGGGFDRTTESRLARRVGLNPTTMYDVGLRPARPVDGSR